MEKIVKRISEFYKKSDLNKVIVIASSFGVITIVLLMMSVVALSSASDQVVENEKVKEEVIEQVDEEIESEEQEETKKLISVIDFSNKSSDEINSWCNENSIDCNIINEYSDTIPESGYISQSIQTNEQITDNESITIVFSLGKEPTREQKNALDSANSYLNFTHFSRSGLYDQLEYEGYPHDAIEYALNNIIVDWNQQALGTANDYLDYTSFSNSGLYDQLIYEGFTAEQAQYAIDNLDN